MSSKRNQTVNRIYQAARLRLNRQDRHKLREALNDAYDAGRSHGIDLAEMTLGYPTTGRPPFDPNAQSWGLFGDVA